ncbi:MAG: Ubiquinone biosynthesis O-methyltransferase [Glaciecola sp. HTCC2999]|nr:MAG: Ubiquinone biosynthesis O-methyltransferase [Glaciecola sp. HTCC2999]
MLDKSALYGSVSQTLDPEEVARFDSLAEQWWDPIGQYGQAIAFNHARLAYFTSQIAEHFALDLPFEPSPNENLWRLYDLGKPLSGLSILDVGCGGGLVSEPLARLGGEVTGIDASAMSIQVATQHAQNTKTRVTYCHTLAEELVAKQQQYDVVINAEVVEHVQNQSLLINQCAQLVKPGGILILATLNRTVTSYVFAIVGAEYVMRYLPIGTHSWRKFVKPNELSAWANASECELINQTGMKFNAWNKRWRYTDSLAINYVQCFIKNKGK